MSTIFMDPVQMDATAGHVSDHVNELTTIAGDLESSCSAVVPASIAGWLTDELHEIAVTVQLIAMLYAVAALETAQRAQLIQADQSLATAVPALASTSATFTGAPLVGGIAPFATSSASTGFLAGSSIPDGFVLGQVAPSSSGPIYGQPQGFMLGNSGPSIVLGGYTPSFGGGSIYSGLDSPGTFDNRLWTLSDERTGTTFVSPGIYERRGQVGDWNSLPAPDDE